jgi:hypothetical protein
MMDRSPAQDMFEILSRLLTGLAFVLGILAAVSAPLLALAWSNRPFPGFMIEPTLVVTDRSGAGWPGVQAGMAYPMRIERMAGFGVGSTWDFQRLMLALDEGQAVPVLTRMPEGTGDLFPGVELISFPEADLVRLFLIPYLVGLAYLAIAIWIYRVRGRTRPGRALAFFCTSTALACILLFDLSTTHVGAAVWTLAVAMLGGGLISLAMRFPEDWRLAREHGWLLAIPYLVSLALGVWGISTVYDTSRPWAYIGPWGASYRYTALAILIFLVTTIVRAVSGQSPLVRRQSRLMLLGGLLAFLPIAIWFMLPVIGLSIPFSAGLLLPGLLFFPAAVAAAIFRYRLFEVDTLVNRAVVYAFLTAILAGVFTAAIGLSQRLFVEFTGERSDAAVVITTLIVAAAFTPLKGWLQGLVDRRLNDAPGRTKDLRVLGDRARDFADMADAEQLSRRLLERAVHDLDAQGGAVRLAGDGGLRSVHTVGTWRGAAQVSVPLIARGERIGLLQLGPRRNGEAYEAMDFEALVEVSGEVARALDHALREGGPTAPFAGEPTVHHAASVERGRSAGRPTDT